MPLCIFFFCQRVSSLDRGSSLMSHHERHLRSMSHRVDHSSLLPKSVDPCNYLAFPGQFDRLNLMLANLCIRQLKRRDQVAFLYRYSPHWILETSSRCLVSQRKGKPRQGRVQSLHRSKMHITRLAYSMVLWTFLLRFRLREDSQACQVFCYFLYLHP